MYIYRGVFVQKRGVGRGDGVRVDGGRCRNVATMGVNHY